jgi:hypothetical protein
MIDEDHLPFFITEDIYIVAEDEVATDAGTTEAIQEQPKSTAPEPQPKQQPPVPEIPKVTPKIHELAIWSPPLTAQDKDLLVKILAAIKKDFNAAHLMQGINAYEPHFKTLLCFGYQKELEMKTGKSVLMYDPTTISEKQILVSVAPADLHNDPAQKKRLWEALQKMFL